MNPPREFSHGNATHAGSHGQGRHAVETSPAADVAILCPRSSPAADVNLSIWSTLRRESRVAGTQLTPRRTVASSPGAAVVSFLRFVGRLLTTRCIVHRFATALLVSGLGIGAVPAMASAQSGIGSIGSILLPSVPSGVYYPTTGTAHGKKNGNAKREYIDAAGCKVKEQSKPDGDYKYERNCKHADKNLAKAQK